MKIIRTERGWAGHFICADRCNFRRNTLLQYGKKFVVVSTVGNMVDHDGEIDAIGAFGRMYETMAFKSDPEDALYHDADVSEEISVPENTKWAINEIKHESDLEADAMHENYAKVIEKMLVDGEIT